ncbi:hypothetical protein Hdeb2414_s0007g00250751 [Helianthus debilis subsp. tardiflorus]
MMEAIKEDAFVWISNRSKLPTLDWDNWMSFDVSVCCNFSAFCSFCSVFPSPLQGSIYLYI